jgi:arginine exporter protein ArgO
MTDNFSLKTFLVAFSAVVSFKASVLFMEDTWWFGPLMTIVGWILLLWYGDLRIKDKNKEHKKNVF